MTEYNVSSWQLRDVKLLTFAQTSCVLEIITLNWWIVQLQQYVIVQRRVYFNTVRAIIKQVLQNYNRNSNVNNRQAGTEIIISLQLTLGSSMKLGLAVEMSPSVFKEQLTSWERMSHAASADSLLLSTWTV